MTSYFWETSETAILAKTRKKDKNNFICDSEQDENRD